MKRLLLVLSFALLSGIGLTAATPTIASASTWDHSCQTISYDFAYDGSGLASWGATIRLTATGCWNATSSWTTAFSQSTPRNWLSNGYLQRNSQGSGAYYGDTLYWANYTENSLVETCDPFGIICGLLPPTGGNHGLYPRIRLTNLRLPDRASWLPETSCSLDWGTDITGCSVSTPSLSPISSNPGPVTQYSSAPPPAAGTCHLIAKMNNAPVFQTSGNGGYGPWLVNANAGTDLWVSRASLLRSQTYFLPVLTGYPFAGKLIMMSQIDAWGGSYWHLNDSSGTCH